MNRTLITGLVIIFACLMITSGVSSAVNSELQLTIVGVECTLDTTYGQLQASLNIQPENCEQPDVVQRIQSQQIDLPPSTNRLVPIVDGTPGDQRFFEDTPFEPIASWSGIGDSTASAARPIIATGVLTAVIIGMIDMLFLELRLTQMATTFSRRGFALLGNVLTRGF